MTKMTASLIGAMLSGTLALAPPTWAMDDKADDKPDPVSVEYKDSKDFTDASDRGLYGRASESVMKELSTHFQKEGAKYLKDGQTLEIEVTDIDLAGRFEPSRSPGLEDVRLMRDITWPRMQFNYSVKQDDEVVDSGEAKLSDMSYLTSSRPVGSNESMYYDKRMIDRWFRKHFETEARTTASAQ
jgi:hypothetical protein